MISAIIQGINPVLPVLLILITALIALFISWWTYNYLDSIATWKKWSLITLRFISFSILLILLLNPFITSQFTASEQPAIAVYLDDSESMSVERGEYSGSQSYQQVLDNFLNEIDDRVDVHYYLFDSEIRTGNDLSLMGSATIFDRVIDHIQENETRYSASVLFSDGIVTQGRNPLFQAQNITLPLITIPIGDTTDVKDIAISDVEYNEPLFTNSMNTISVEIRQQGYKDEESNVLFTENGELIESKNISFTSESGGQILEFTREYSQPGFYELEFHVPPKEDEFTDRNNTQTVTIEVIDDKTRILSIAFEIHPDVRSIRRVVATNQQNELITSTYIGNNQFAGQSPLEIDGNLDLIIVHGLPEVNNPVLNWLQDRNEPIIHLPLPRSFDSAAINDLADLIPLRSDNIQTLLDIHLANLEDAGSHPLLVLPSVALNRLPTLQSYRGVYISSPLSQSLLQAEFQRERTDIPVLVVEDTGTRRSASVNAFGWFRYEQTQQNEARQFFDQFFNNLVSWAVTSPENRNLILEPRKRTFNENEQIEIRAVLTNELGEPEPNALIDIEFFDDDLNQQRTFRMSHVRDGIYDATLGSYPEGLYQVSATANMNSRIIGEAESRILVSRSNLELINTRRNDALLEQLSLITNGLFLENHSMSDLNSFLSERDLFQQREEVFEEVSYIYQSAFWFFIVILLLTAEWLLRRSVSLP
jgi:hypothetical protein